MRTTTRIIRAAVILGTLMLGCASAFAQPTDNVQPEQRASYVIPAPAAYHLRTRHLLVGVQGDVRRVEEGAAGRLIDRGRVYTSPRSRVLRVRVDARRERLWVLNTGAVHAIDLATGRRVKTIELPNWILTLVGESCLPDLQVDAHGAAFVSDNSQAKLWRIDGDDFSVRERNVYLEGQPALGAGFTALAIAEGGAMFGAIATTGTLWRIDGDLSRAQKVALDAPIHGACGMEFRRDTRSGEVTLFVLSAGRGRFALRGVTLAPDRSAATVHMLELSSANAPAGLLASSRLAEWNRDRRK